jgi:pimeloyl-ACP methyl ester carboxylesterase
MMRELWLNAGAGKVYGRANGPEDGTLVLGLHGWSQRNGWHTWEPLLAPLGAAGFYAVAVDMPGWGWSTAFGDGPITKGQAMKSVLEIIAALGKETAVLMGKSWGGGIALNIALSHPGSVTKLILTAPAFRRIDQLANVQQPVLLAWAQDDPVIPFEMAEIFIQNLPHCRFIPYLSGGHSAAPKNAETFAPEAITFLEN